MNHNSPRFILNSVLGALFIAAVAFFGWTAYQEANEYLPTPEQQLVGKNYSFTLRCTVQEPILGIWQQWRLSDAFEQPYLQLDSAIPQAWVYVVPCLAEDASDIETVDNGVKSLMPAPEPGLHIITIADSALISRIDWDREFRLKGFDPTNPSEQLPRKLSSLTFTHPNMRLYEMYLVTNQNIKVLCHQTIDTQGSTDPRDWRPYNICSSN